MRAGAQDGPQPSRLRQSLLKPILACGVDRRVAGPILIGIVILCLAAPLHPLPIGTAILLGVGVLAWCSYKQKQDPNWINNYWRALHMFAGFWPNTQDYYPPCSHARAKARKRHPTLP
jgi:hypothetical protein